MKPRTIYSAPTPKPMQPAVSLLDMIINEQEAGM
jgi:hypothetical protein